MTQTPRTFPPLHRWQSMSETEQDSLLDKIEGRRRRRAIKARTISLICCAVALAAVTLLVAH
jgi:predicted Fe-S protein YdhL (DUF1289 family)